MKILVPVKQVEILDEDFGIRDDGRDVDPDSVEYERDEWDDYSWETALQLAEKHEGAIEAIPMTVGPEDAEEGLRKCLARGGERGIRVWDDAAEGSDPTARARLTAAVAKRENAKLVFAGTRSTGHGHGQTGIATAAIPGWPHVAVVSGFDCTPGAGTAVVRRELEGGVEEEIEIRLPAVPTIQPGINEPRYASLRGIKRAKAKPVEVIAPQDPGIGADRTGKAGSAARIRRLYIPDRGKAELIGGTPAEQAKRLPDIVNELRGA